MLLIISHIFNTLNTKRLQIRKSTDFRLHKTLKIYTKMSERGCIMHLRSLIFITLQRERVCYSFFTDAAMRKRANSSMKSMVFEIPSTEELTQRS